MFNRIVAIRSLKFVTKLYKAVDVSERFFPVLCIMGQLFFTAYYTVIFEGFFEQRFN